jgi:LmbE family N-acetylglucosaminyl deacetylase
MGTPVQIQGSAIVLRRPHYRQVGDELFFLISRRPHVRLSAVERAVWTALESAPSVDELHASFPQDADWILRRFAELGLCEIVETSSREGRRRVLVFEPHSDDAVLSVGGTMWLRRHECEFIVITIGSRSNFTSYYYLDRDYFNVDQVSSLRNAEGALFARLLGGKHRALGQPEATLRYHGGDWSLDWYRRHQFSVSAYIDHHSGAGELRGWIEAIQAALGDSRADEVWFPLGSPHTDHQLTRDAALTLLLDDPKLFRGCEVRFYQDVPYAVRCRTFTPTILEALTRAGAILVPETVPIDSAFTEKLKLISLYGSQFKLDAIGPDVEASARMADGHGGLAERFWLLKKPPAALDLSSLRADEPVVRRAMEQLASWALNHRDAKRIRLLLLVPAGRWAEDMEYLLQFFPKARFDAYIASAAAAEVAEFVSPRICVRHVAAGTKAWVFLAIRLILMRPAATLFLAGERRLREARFLSAFWPLSDPVVLPTMDDLVSALRRLALASRTTPFNEASIEGDHNDRPDRRSLNGRFGSKDRSSRTAS